MLLWYPTLKLIVTVALFWLATLPLQKHYRAYRARREDWANGKLNHREVGSPLPTRTSAYLPLMLVAVLFVMTPFQLVTHDQQARVISTFDRPAVQPAPIERRVRSQYEAPDNREFVDAFMNKESNP